MPTRLNVYIPEDLDRRMEPFKNELNKSRICAEALEREVERLEREKRRREFEARALTYAATEPIALSELQRTGKLTMPPQLMTTVAGYSPAEREGALEGWQGGTISVWQVLKASERPVLPMEYTPPSKGDKSES